MRFDKYIGIDYSGAGTPESRQSGLRVFSSTPGCAPKQIDSPDSPLGRRHNWTRRGLATWLRAQKLGRERFVVGVDHALSVPREYLDVFELRSWDGLLLDFVQHWPTHMKGQTVEALRVGNPRLGNAEWFRLTERWTSSAKSVFRFDVQGQVAKSTHAGLPWIQDLRCAPGRPLHFWPFDGFIVQEEANVVVEVYPSIFRHRYPQESRSTDEQDAYSTARWLEECDRAGTLDRYLHPPLTEGEKTLAALEGWILGVT